MANVYPHPTGIEKLRDSNPRYWALCVSRSKYSEDEINSALDELVNANLAIQEFLSTTYDLLVDEDGEMNWKTGFATKAHQQLSEMLASELNYTTAHMSENSHANCFPVAKWQKETKYIYRQIAKVQKFIDSNFRA